MAGPFLSALAPLFYSRLAGELPEYRPVGCGVDTQAALEAIAADGERDLVIEWLRAAADPR